MTVTVDPASALPPSVGVVSFVAVSAAGLVIDGAAGPVLSITKLRTTVTPLPAASVWVRVTEWGPSASEGVVNGELHGAATAPSTAQVVLPTWLSLTLKTTSGVCPLTA